MDPFFPFTENGLTVRILESAEDHKKAFRLRHAVYCEALKWVPPHPGHLEQDHYEQGSVSLGVLNGQQDLLGVVRIVPGSQPFMLEADFAPLVDPSHPLRKRPDTAEITRLATRPDMATRIQTRLIAPLLYKAIYRWVQLSYVRYLYFVVETRYLRALRRTGFPCVPIGHTQILGAGPGAVECAAVILDRQRFQDEFWAHPTPFLRRLTGLTASPLNPDPVSGTVRAGAAP